MSPSFPFVICFDSVADLFGVTDDGSMAKDKREMSLAKIRESRSTKVILISFKAGSTGEFDLEFLSSERICANP